jgi:integrase
MSRPRSDGCGGDFLGVPKHEADHPDIARNLEPKNGKTDHIEWDDDCPGLGVRLRGGSKRWTVQYRVGSQQRRESLGDVRKLNVEDARKIARQRFAKVELGVDPAAERAQAKAQAALAALTLGVVSDRYLEAKERVLRQSTHKASRRYFELHWQPLRDRPIEVIKRAEVAARLQEIISVHGRTAAARARERLSAFYTWAMKEGLCEANPVVATNDPGNGILPRDRVLSDDELRTIWKACEKDAAGGFGDIVRLLLLTGARREEIGGLRWSELDLRTGVMIIPGTRTKNHKPLELTLPSPALEMLGLVPRHEGRDFVFGRNDDAPFSGWSAGKLRLDARIAMMTGKSLAPWVLHDLRRTMRTGLSVIGVQPHIAELVINHVKGGVEAIYDRHTYRAEIKAALARWAERIVAVTEGREHKIVPLRGAS